MKFLLLAALALTGTATAQAAQTYNCAGANYRDQVEAVLTLSPGARGGRIELDRFDHAFPLGLIHADLRRPQTQGEELVLQSEKDSHNGRTATVRIPADFASMEKFSLLVQTESRPQGYPLLCSARE